ncbi:hypothetical protein Anas_10423, partial [Armadillidium nasatum]
FINRDLKDQLHLMGVNIGFAFIAGSAVIICTDFESITKDRHTCVVLGTLLQFFYGALGFWGVAIGHASFRAITRGVIGGNLIPACMMCWGVSLLLTGIPFIEFLEDLGTDPRCFISWENVPKYPILHTTNSLLNLLNVLRNCYSYQSINTSTQEGKSNR